MISIFEQLKRSQTGIGRSNANHLSMRAGTIRTYSSCLKAQRARVAGLTIPTAALRTFTTTPPLASGQAVARKHEQDDEHKAEKEEGAMFRRLAEMTEESVDTGGSSAAKSVEAAGFSEELKKQLQSRIAESAFRSQNQKAFAEAEMPVCECLTFFETLHSFSRQIVLRRQRHSRSSDSSTMDGFRISP